MELDTLSELRQKQQTANQSTYNFNRFQIMWSTFTTFSKWDGEELHHWQAFTQRVDSLLWSEFNYNTRTHGIKLQKEIVWLVFNFVCVCMDLHHGVEVLSSLQGSLGSVLPLSSHRNQELSSARLLWHLRDTQEQNVELVEIIVL